MKRTILVAVIALASVSVFAQKKGTKKSVAKPSSSNVLAKSGDVSAQIGKDFFYVSTNSTGKDTIGIKKLATGIFPKDCTLKTFSAKGTPLYQLTWTEEATTKTELKTEVKKTVYSQIINPATKEKLFSNQNTVTNITEKVFLDRLKNASETQERVRREGFDLEVTPEGDLVQKNKSQQNNYVFSEPDKKYVSGKTTSVAAPKPVVKKKKA